MHIDHAARQFDAIVIGGSYAGLSASMQLARARRRVLVIDAGLRRNRFATTAHGFLAHDGQSPEAIASQGRAQVLAYPNVHWIQGTATHAEQAEGIFTIAVDDRDVYAAKRLVLATGVIDELPAVEGLAERWGRSVFHCPYCHGYELDNGRIGVLASGPLSMHHAMMLPDWGQVTLFTNSAFMPDPDQHAALQERGVVIEPARVQRIVETATLELDDGRRMTMDGLFTLSRTRMSSPVAEQLQCAFEEGPLGPYLRTEASMETSVAGAFACGDAARIAGSVAIAVGDGMLAGVGAHQSMIFR